MQGILSHLSNKRIFVFALAAIVFLTLLTPPNSTPPDSSPISVLPESSPKRILLLNFHTGVKNEFEGVLSLTGKHVVTQSRLVGENEIRGYDISRAKSELWWESNKQICDGTKYDAILVGDTTPLARPLLMGNCSLPIVIIVTNRFDYGLQTADRSYYDLMEEACIRKNVFCAANNKLEGVYAARVRKCHLWLREYLPSAGFASPIAQEIYKTRAKTLPEANDQDTYVMASGANSKLFLLPALQEAGIKLESLPNRGYGGPIALKDRILVHMPYQSNTMAFFENLAQRVIYIAPSVKLFRSWAKDLGGVNFKDLKEHEFMRVCDWYRPEFADFFSTLTT